MNKLINKTVKWAFAAIAGAMLLGACSKDEPVNRLTLDTDKLFLTSFGQTATVGFWTENVSVVEVTSFPAGWTVKADLATKLITVTAPAELDGTKSVRSGAVVVKGSSTLNSPVTARLFVTVSATKDISDVQSNSFIISQPYTTYSFDATRKGESSQTIAPADVRILWQTDSELIKYANYTAGKFSFYADGTDLLLQTEGNALVGAYDGDGNLLWSWHLWLVNADDVKEQTYANGKTFMSLNLGSLGNTNKTTNEILASYGMFYQWGRKDPFVGPHTYNAARGEDHYIYDAEGRRIKVGYVQSDPQVGTIGYASANPLNYLLGVKDNEYDWLVTSSNDLWANTKTINDPCPKGWRVPSASDFEGLDIVNKAAGTENQFGWELTDGKVTAYYPGAGFRTYLTGKIQNIYNPISGVEVPKPWVGNYWTVGTDGKNATAMYFWLDAANKEQSGIEPAVARHRANGMQIRCVRE